MSSSTSIQNQKFTRVGTFADLLVRYIHERKGGDTPAVYNAARIDRRTYSSIGNVRVGLKWCGWSGGVVWRMVRMVGCVGSAAREGEVLSVE